MTTFGEAPKAWKAGTFTYCQGLTLKTAKKMLEAGEKEAVKQGVQMALAITDAGGNLLAFHRMDDTMLAGSRIAMDKAYTAVFGKQPTDQCSAPFKSGLLVSLFFHERWITFPGGYPLIQKGKIYGGAGVSGGIIEDCYVTRAMLQAGGYETDDLDRFITENQCKQ